MTEEEALLRLTEAGALLLGKHIVMTSGRHTDTYANFRVFLEKEREAELRLFCRALAELFRHVREIDFVIGPQRGGAIIAELVADILHGIFGTYVRPIIAFKQEGSLEKKPFIYEDDRAFLPGKLGLFTDDVLATGSSYHPVEEAVRRYGGSIIAMGVIVNRSGLAKEHFRLPYLKSLATINARDMTHEECSEEWLCRQGVPITLKPGHGAAFVAKYGQPAKR